MLTCAGQPFRQQKSIPFLGGWGVRFANRDKKHACPAKKHSFFQGVWRVHDKSMLTLLW